VYKMIFFPTLVTKVVAPGDEHGHYCVDVTSRSGSAMDDVVCFCE